jgi:hypothetical protein
VLFLFRLAVLIVLHAPAAFAVQEGCVGPSSLTGHEFFPNCSAVNRTPDGKVWPFTTNDVGLIAVGNYPAVPAKGTLRLLVVGPSDLVNLSPTVGIVPTLETRLRKLLLHRGFPYRKLEVVNGAESGFTAVQTYLRLPQLMARYHPAAVLFLHTFRGMALQQVDDHYSSTAFDAYGLSKAMRNTGAFWLLPESLAPWIWAHVKSAPRLRVQLLGLRLAMYKLAIRLGFGRYAPHEGFSPYAYLHLAYVGGISREAEAGGAKFFLLNSETTSFDPEREFAELQKMNSWYKPEWVAGKLAPWPHLRLDEARRVYGRLEREYTFVHLEGFSVYSSLRYANDYHPNELGMRMLGNRYAEAIAPALRAAFGRRGAR